MSEIEPEFPMVSLFCERTDLDRGVYDSYLPLSPELVQGLDLPEGITRLILSQTSTYGPRTIDDADALAADLVNGRQWRGIAYDWDRADFWINRPRPGEIFVHEQVRRYPSARGKVVHTLGAAGLATVMTNAREAISAAPEQLRAQEKVWFDSMPRIDRSKPLDLLEGVEVDVSDEALAFHVPPRALLTDNYGMLSIDVRGRQVRIKEEEDFSEERFTSRGHHLRLAKAFLTEDVEYDSLPVFRDQSRVSLEVSIGNPYRWLAGMNDVDNAEVLLTTSGDTLELVLSEDLIAYQGFVHRVIYGEGVNLSRELGVVATDYESGATISTISGSNIPRPLLLPEVVLWTGMPKLYLHSEDLGIVSPTSR